MQVPRGRLFHAAAARQIDPRAVLPSGGRSKSQRFDGGGREKSTATGIVTGQVAHAKAKVVAAGQVAHVKAKVVVAGWGLPEGCPPGGSGPHNLFYLFKP